MKTLETKRLILRPFMENDFDAVHSYAKDAGTVRYMDWGPNEQVHTHAFISLAIEMSKVLPCKNHQYAAILKADGKLIGACNIVLSGEDGAQVGWILHKDHHNQGYGTEMAGRIVGFGFDGLDLHRITARCDTENIASYRVMEKIGMRREGCFIQGRHANKLSKNKYSDEYLYAVIKDEWNMSMKNNNFKMTAKEFMEWTK